MSGGRFEFSWAQVGRRKEFRTYGLEFLRWLNVTNAWTKRCWLLSYCGASIAPTFHGRYYHLEDAPCEPKPVQFPHPPITVGGRPGARVPRPSTLTGLASIASPEKCAELITVLETMRQGAGLNCDGIEFSVHTTLALTGRKEDAEAYASRVAASHGVPLA